MSTNIAGVPIDFGPIVQEPDDVSSITGKYQMPCGCKLTQKVINKGSFGSSVASKEFTDAAKKRLIYWFEKRIPWHQCNLVASENPSGIIPKDLRRNRTPPFGYLLNSGQVSDASIEQEIQAKGLTAPLITPAYIEANIASEHYFTACDGVLGALAADGVPATIYEQAKAAPQSLSLLTFCVLVLRNGFTVTGESACASPENFDAEIGKKIARANAVQKIWPLMGYALKEQLFRSSLIKCEVGKVLGVQIIDGNRPTISPHQQRVIAEKRELDDKLGKLDQFINGSAIFDGLPIDEQDDLVSQHGHMAQYSRYLASRIARFAVPHEIHPPRGPDWEHLPHRAPSHVQHDRASLHQQRRHSACIFQAMDPRRQGMNTYIGTKVVRAVAMTRQAYNALRGWMVPADENGADEGYLVEYVDGGKPNVPGYTGYVSWSPKEQFDNAYINVATSVSFGMALEALKRGFHVARAGWNGAGQWVTMSGPRDGTKVSADSFWSKNNADFVRDQPDSEVTVTPYFTIKNAQDQIAVWVPSTSDCLANDWRVLT